MCYLPCDGLPVYALGRGFVEDFTDDKVLCARHHCASKPNSLVTGGGRGRVRAEQQQNEIRQRERTPKSRAMFDTFVFDETKVFGNIKQKQRRKHHRLEHIYPRPSITSLVLNHKQVFLYARFSTALRKKNHVLLLRVASGKQQHGCCDVSKTPPPAPITMQFLISLVVITDKSMRHSQASPGLRYTSSSE